MKKTNPNDEKASMHDAFRQYQIAYLAKNYRSFMFRVRKDRDANLISFCEQQENLTAFIVNLIKQEMARQGIED